VYIRSSDGIAEAAACSCKANVTNYDYGE